LLLRNVKYVVVVFRDSFNFSLPFVPISQKECPVINKIIPTLEEAVADIH